jgi:hypothetical protein
MSETRKDHKGRKLWNGESQRKDGKYEYKYQDAYGKRKTVYSWKLTPSDTMPKGKRNDLSLREKEQLIQKLKEFSGEPQRLELPSAPKQFIQYLEEDNRPQVNLDVDYENGMGVSVGRIREDKVYDFKFVGLSHNTVRGAAGGAVLCAELLKAQGYITKK